MYYPSSENKGADQLRGYREADLRLCFRIGKNPVFSRCGSFMDGAIHFGDSVGMKYFYRFILMDIRTCKFIKFVSTNIFVLIYVETNCSLNYIRTNHNKYNRHNYLVE